MNRTPRKINMEPENTGHLEEENHRPNRHYYEKGRNDSTARSKSPRWNKLHLYICLHW